MHFKNGRAANEGDPVIFQDYGKNVKVGNITNLQAGQESCNCSVVAVTYGGTYTFTCQTVGEMYHAADGFNALVNGPDKPTV